MGCIFKNCKNLNISVVLGGGRRTGIQPSPRSLS